MARRSATPSRTSGTRRRKRSFWTEIPGLVVIAIVLTMVIQAFVARIFVIPSASMEQTLIGCRGCTNDRVVADRVTYRFTEPEPGDVVVFEGPPAWQSDELESDEGASANPLARLVNNVLAVVGAGGGNKSDFVKRVIAVGGQTVACCDASNRVLVDGKPLIESYLYLAPDGGPTQAGFPPLRVPEGQLWVMGDNRNNSADSRAHGSVPVSAVIGRVRAVVLPISRWRSVPNISPQTEGSPG